MIPMKELTLFYFDGCPHCANAMRWQQELFLEHPDWKEKIFLMH